MVVKSKFLILKKLLEQIILAAEDLGDPADPETGVGRLLQKS